MARPSTSLTSSARTISSGSVARRAANPILPPISAACPHAISTSGSSSATAPPAATTLADLRAGGGDRDPFNVRFWGVGNESWGCGGNFTPEEYATEFRRFTAWIPRYGVDLALIASGPNSGDLSWTRRFLSTLTEKGEGALRWRLGPGSTSLFVERQPRRDNRLERRQG